MNVFGQAKAAQISRDMIEKLEAERERTTKRQMYDHLLGAFKYAPQDTWAPSPIATEAETLGAAIRRKIDEHKQMIAALEWFAAHVSLDDPKDNQLVARIVLEGLNSINNRNRP